VEQADLLLARQSAALLSSCARPKILMLRWRTTHRGYHQQRMERVK
jgi:hypothetical protein